MKANQWIVCGALLGGLAVGAGAFGAHYLSGKLKQNAGLSSESREQADHLLDVFHTAGRYHMYHALAMTLVGLMAARTPSAWLTAAGWLFVLGIVVFCGCLYAIALGGPKFLGAVVPVGGLSFIVGWLCLAAAAWQRIPEL